MLDLSRTGEGAQGHRALPHRRFGRASRPATAATIARSPITPAATGIARSARRWPAPSGRRSPPEFLPAPTSIWSSAPQRARWWPCRTSDCFTACCSKRPAQDASRSRGQPTHLGAPIGVLAVLHTWGQNLMHHPHLHCVVSGGGLSADGRVDRREAALLPAGAGPEPSLSER